MNLSKNLHREVYVLSTLVYLQKPRSCRGTNIDLCRFQFCDVQDAIQINTRLYASFLLYKYNVHIKAYVEINSDHVDKYENDAIALKQGRVSMN